MNYITEKTAFIFLQCTMIFSLHSMDLEVRPSCNDGGLQSTQRPTIIGKIYIVDSVHGLSACYASEKYHVELCQTGIHSWLQVPVIPVAVIHTKKVTCANAKVINIDTNWVKTASPEIIEFETEKFHKKLDNAYFKKFPAFVPATLLYKAKTGTILSLTIHGYPAQLECIDSSYYNRSFESCYAQAVKNFLLTATYHESDDTIDNNSSLDNLVKFGLLALFPCSTCECPRHYVHGENGFVSIEKLIFDRLQEKNQSAYLLLCWVHARERLAKETR